MLLPELLDSFDLIMAILPVSQFINTIQDLFQHKDEFIAIRAISTLEEKIVRHENEPDYCVLLIPLVKSLVQVVDSNIEIPDKIIATFSCCGELARVLGDSHREDLIILLPFIIGKNGLDHAEEGVVSAALMTLNYFLRSLGPRIIPFFPQFMKGIINMLNKEVKSGIQIPLIFTSGFLTVNVISEVLPQFMSTYTSDIIKIAMNPNISKLNSKKCFESVYSCLETMSEHIAPRHLLPVIVASINDVFIAGKSSITILFTFLTNILKKISKSDILEFRSELSKFFLEAFDFRAKINSNVGQAEILEVENCVITSFFNLVLKLNDEHFKPIYLKLVDWATLSISFDNLSPENIIKRQITFFHIINEMFNRLKVTFTLINIVGIASSLLLLYY